MTTATTRDLGFLIRDMIEGRDMHIYRKDDGELTEIGDDDGYRVVDYVDYVDVSDPDNLIVTLKKGETFNVRITRRG